MPPFSNFDDALVYVDAKHPNQNEKKQLRIARKVGFSKCMVEIHFVRHHNDYSQTEKERAWFSMDEIRSFRNGIVKHARELSKDPNYIPSNEDTSTWCKRGVECRTKSVRKRRNRNFVRSLKAVFFEQSMQRLEGINDQDAIADSYYEYSGPSHAAAHVKALHDEVEAKAIYRDNDAQSISTRRTTSASISPLTSSKITSKISSLFCFATPKRIVEEESLNIASRHPMRVVSSAA